MFKEIKRKIKMAKISAVVFAIIFVSLIISNIYLLFAVHNLQEIMK